MKHIKDEVIEKKLLGRWNIGIRRYFIDIFGKEHTEYRDWDDYANKAIWEREKDKELQKMFNCGFNIK